MTSVEYQEESLRLLAAADRLLDMGESQDAAVLAHMAATNATLAHIEALREERQHG